MYVYTVYIQFILCAHVFSVQARTKLARPPRTCALLLQCAGQASGPFPLLEGDRKSIQTFCENDQECVNLYSLGTDSVCVLLSSIEKSSDRFVEEHQVVVLVYTKTPQE